MTPENIPEHHAARLRARLRTARRQLSEAERDHGALCLRGRLYTWLARTRAAARAAGAPAPQVIAAYWPLPDEPDLRPLLTQWVAAGLTVVLPVVVQKHAPLAFRLWRPDTVMAAGAYGILAPQDTAEMTPDVLLVPTLGYTDEAYRLGYGGGYYDRTLAALRAKPPVGEGLGQRATLPIAIGVAWRCGRITAADGWQPAPHDVPLHAVLTPQDWYPAWFPTMPV